MSDDDDTPMRVPDKELPGYSPNPALREPPLAIDMEEIAEGMRQERELEEQRKRFGVSPINGASVFKVDGTHIATKFDAEAKARYIAALAERSTRTHAARAAGVSAYCAKQHEDRDPVFKAACDVARQQFADRVERTAQYLALEGVLEPIYDKEGNHIGNKRVFATNILQMLMKRTNPEYKEKSEHDVNLQVGVGVLVVPGRTQTMDDVKASFDQFALEHKKEPGT